MKPWKAGQGATFTLEFPTDNSKRVESAGKGNGSDSPATLKAVAAIFQSSSSSSS